MTAFAVIADKLIALIRAIIWPSVIVGVLYFFEDDLRKALSRLSDIKGPGFEASLEPDLKEAEEQAESASLPEIDENFIDPPTNVRLSSLREIAELAPRAGIVQAWEKVLETAREAVRHSGHSVQAETPASGLIELLHAEDLIDMHSVSLLHSLRTMRNKAAASAHMHDVSEEEATRYIRIAERMMGHLMNVI